MRHPCVFCGRPLKGKAASAEHIIPLWLQTALNIESEEIQLTVTRIYDLQVANQRNTHQLRNLVAGTVCRVCNGSWMSDLETAVRNPLLRLTRNELLLRDLSRVDHRRLAFWATKTAYVLDSIWFERRVATEHFRALKHGKLPVGVTVFAHQHEPTRRVWLQGDAEWHTDGDASYAEMMFIVRTGYKISIQLDHLILLVTYWPFGNWSLRAIPGIHHILAKTTHRVGRWNLRWQFPRLTETRVWLLAGTVGARRRWSPASHS